MAERFDDEFRARLGRLEADLAEDVPPAPRIVGRRAAPRLTPLSLVASLALLVIGFIAGCTTHQLAWDRDHPALFSNGGALYCSGIQEMAPPEAALALAALGYDVTWQVEDHAAHTVVLASEPPDSGRLAAAVQMGPEAADLQVVVQLDDTYQHVNFYCGLGEPDWSLAAVIGLALAVIALALVLLATIRRRARRSPADDTSA